MGPPMTRGPFDTSIPRPELDLKYAEFPMGPPIKGQNIASELYKTIAPDFKLPPQPTPLRPPPRFGPDNPAPRGPIQLRSPDNMIRGTTNYRMPISQTFPQIADALALTRRVAKPGETGGSLSETMKDGSVFDKIRELYRPNVPMPPRFDISKIDPSKGPFDLSRLQDAIRNAPGRSYEDVVAAGGGGINPGGMFDDISPFQPQVITKGLDGKDYPNPGAAERANRIFLANQAANQAAELGGDDMILADPDMLETPPTDGGYDGGGINPVIGPNGERLYDMPETGTGPFQPTQPTPPTGEMPPIGNNPEDSFNIPPAEEAAPPAEAAPPVTGDPNDPLSSLYGQIGVADEAGARDVIESILSGQQDQMTEDQRNLTGTGIYRRIANRLGIKDREGNLITPLSTVVTGDDRRVTPTGSQALRYLQDMEDMEGGTGIEMLLNFLQGRMRAPESRPTGPFGTVPGGGSRYGMPQNPYMPQMPYMPQPPIFGGGFGGFGGYGGYGSPGMGGYMGMRPSLPYAGMSSPMFPSIFGMAPPSYYGGMPSMYGNYGGGFPIVNRRQQASNGMQGMGMSNPMPGAGGGVTN